MIIWSGRGILIVLIFFLTLIACLQLIPNEFDNYAFVIACYMAGIFSWYFGNKWNQKSTRTFIDEKTGERFAIRNNHTLFWIKMQYWGIILLGFATYLLALKSIWQASISGAIVLILILLKYKTGNNKNNFPQRQTKKTIEKPVSNFSQENEKEEIKVNEIKKDQDKEDHSRFMPK